MNEEKHEKLRQAQLEIMDEIHRICVENDITYYIIGGTALGAVRHGGFIPWDVDIDIAMKRKDYDKFKEVCQTQLNPRFLYRDYKNTPDIRCFHALMCMKNTLVIDKCGILNPRERKYEIYIDIFPLDNAPVDDTKQSVQAKEIHRLSMLKIYKRGERYNKNIIKSMGKKIISKMIFWTTLDRINECADKCMRQYNDNETGYICSMASHYSYKKQCMPQDIYGVPQLVDFDGHKYYAPQKLEEYLTRIYKDYMKYPSIEEQEECKGIFIDVVFDK